MKKFSTKNITGSVLDADKPSRVVKVAFAQMGSLDRDNDIIQEGAFTKTISERGPAAKNEIWHLIDHNATLKSALGKPKELYVEGDYLIGVTKIANTTLGNDILELYAEKAIDQHSIGFSVVKDSQTKSGERIIKEVSLWEGSSVLWGANPNTPTMEVYKGMGLEDAKIDLMKKFEILSKTFRNGNLTDESFGLLEIQIKQIQHMISELDTQPAKTVEPDKNEALLKAIQLFNNKI